MERSSEKRIIALFERLGAYKRGRHVVYKNDGHGSEYLDKSIVLADPQAAAEVANEMVMLWHNIADAPRPNVVAGPAASGAKLAVCVVEAFHRLSPHGAEIVAVSVDKDGQGGFLLSPEAAEAVHGKTVLMVEDIVTTAGSLLDAMRAVDEAGGTLLHALAVWNRGGVRGPLLLESERRVPRTDAHVPFQALVARTLISHGADGCPYCKAGIPIDTDLGHGAAYVAKHGQPQKPS